MRTAAQLKNAVTEAIPKIEPGLERSTLDAYAAIRTAGILRIGYGEALPGYGWTISRRAGAWSRRKECRYIRARIKNRIAYRPWLGASTDGNHEGQYKNGEKATHIVLRKQYMKGFLFRPRYTHTVFVMKNHVLLRPGQIAPSIIHEYFQAEPPQSSDSRKPDRDTREVFWPCFGYSGFSGHRTSWLRHSGSPT